MKPVICGDDALHITTQGCSDCDQLEQRVVVLEDCCHDVTNALNSKLEANNIIAGANVTITRSGNNVTINSTGGGGEVTKQAILDALGYQEMNVVMTDTDGVARTWTIIGKAST